MTHIHRLRLFTTWNRSSLPWSSISRCIHCHTPMWRLGLIPFAPQGKETEHNWAAREQSIQRVRGMLKGEVHTRFHEAFLLGLKNGFINASLKTVGAVRTDTIC